MRNQTSRGFHGRYCHICTIYMYVQYFGSVNYIKLHLVFMIGTMAGIVIYVCAMFWIGELYKVILGICEWYNVNVHTIFWIGELHKIIFGIYDWFHGMMCAIRLVLVALSPVLFL